MCHICRKWVVIWRKICFIWPTRPSSAIRTFQEVVLTPARHPLLCCPQRKAPPCPINRAKQTREASMGEILGLGCTHYPGLLLPDERLPGGFHHLLTAPNVPDVSQRPGQLAGPAAGRTRQRPRRRRRPPLWRAHGRRVPRRARLAGGIRSRLRADLRRRPIREFPRGHHPGVLRHGPRPGLRHPALGRRQAEPLGRDRPTGK